MAWLVTVLIVSGCLMAPYLYLRVLMFLDGSSGDVERNLSQEDDGPL